MRRTLALAGFCLVIACVGAVNVGDEIFANSVDGRFYVFADKAIHVINPYDLTVEANITVDQEENALTGSDPDVGRVWNDAVYLQKPSIEAQLVFINEGDTYTETNGSIYGYTSVINAITRQIVGRVKVGARAPHVYAINRTQTAWVHSGADGYFYLLDVNSVSPFEVQVTKVKAFDETPGYGRLVINDALYPVAYGTNAAENVIQKFNLVDKTRNTSFDFTDDLTNSTCSGTASAWYSRANRHIYFECGTVGVFEWNTVTDSFVTQHDVRGTVTGAPKDDRIFVTDMGDRISTILEPLGNGEPSIILRTITVSSQPGDPVFYSNSSSSAPRPYLEYTAFFPTARNTNLNNIHVAGNGNIQTRSYYQMPTDCTYDTGVSASSVDSTSAMGLRLTADSNQSCGACAPGIADLDPTQFNATLAGLRVYEVASEENTAILLSAGAVAPAASASSGANQCSFALPSRAAKRGGAYVATVADFPQPSLYLVLGNTPFARRTEHFVRTATRPRKITWVPNTIRPTG